jgi:uncharacterized repeat protein (TIGR03803 family)
MPARHVKHLITALALVWLLPCCARAGSLTTLATLPPHLDGGYPLSGLTEQGGRLFGTTYLGGANDNGTIFKLDRQTGQVTTLYSFPPSANKAEPGSLIAFGGKLYGLTQNDGDSGFGTAFSLDPATGIETVLHSFASPTRPSGNLTQVGGLLYGASSEGDAIYSLDPATGAEAIVYSFKQDVGHGPSGFLTSYDGMLYGVTGSGGADGHGALFRFDPGSGSAEAVVPFAKKSDIVGSLVVDGGILYGATNKALFAFDPKDGSYTQVKPFHGYQGHSEPTVLLAQDGVLTGVFSDGGGSECGALFSFDLATGKTTLLHQFNRQTDGCGPNMPVLAPGNMLVGTAQTGGPGGDGVAYALDLSTSAYTVLHAFTGGPTETNSGLIALDGTLYGTTGGGGASGFGSIYKIDRHSGRIRILSSFDGGADGTTPETLVAVGNVLYGTTRTGGGSNDGTIFSFDPSTGTRTALFALADATSGRCPCSLAASGGILYGTAAYGGSQTNPGGTVFMFDPSTGAETTLHDFDTVDGYAPNGVLAVARVLYGTTSNGGAHSLGTVFSVNPSSGTFATIHDFKGGSDGSYPGAGLVSVGGTLFGTTTGDGEKTATIFSIDPASGALTSLYQFAGPENLISALSYDAKTNALFGTLFQDNGSAFGSLFRFDLGASTFSTVYSFTGGTDGAYPDSPLLKAATHFFGTTGSVNSESSGTVFRYDP